VRDAPAQNDSTKGKPDCLSWHVAAQANRSA
jgi:hypothetical protein